MAHSEIVSRVNLACNFWADTEGVDYCKDMTRAEILQEDRDNINLVRFFRKELRALGY